MPWLQLSDRPAVKAWAQLEILADEAYSILRKSGLLNAQGEPLRLLTDFRQLRQAQLQFSNALGLTPSARSSIKLNGSGQPFDVGDLSEAEVAGALAAADGNRGTGDDQGTTEICADSENAPTRRF